MNKYNFADVYGVAFGHRGKITEYPDREHNEFEIDFLTPSHSEEDVRFEVSTMAFVFFKDQLVLEILDGDKVLYTSNRGFSMFVNLDGVDPKSGKPTGHPNIPPPQGREGHLLPSHKYTLRVRRTFGPTNKNPISITYYGTDMNEVEFGTDIVESVPMSFAGVDGVFIPNS